MRSNAPKVKEVPREPTEIFDNNTAGKYVRLIVNGKIQGVRVWRFNFGAFLTTLAGIPGFDMFPLGKSVITKVGDDRVKIGTP